MVIFLILLLVLKLSAGQDECTLTTCSDHGPTIRFPFRLNNHQPQHCGYPSFDLSCSQTNDTVLDLPFSVKVLINYINYTSQSIHITDPYGCFPHQLRNLNLSSSPFQFSNFVYDFSLFNCPAKGRQFYHKTCLSGESGSEVIVVYSDFFIYYEPLLSCRKIYVATVKHKTITARDMKISNALASSNHQRNGSQAIKIFLCRYQENYKSNYEQSRPRRLWNSYRGQLSNDVHVAVKILNSSKGNGEDFINEVGIIGRIHHINVVRLVGYCADGFRRALIYEFLPNDSLENFVSSDHEKGLIGWKKLQDIALGIAKGIEYLHQGCDQRILHFDIKPHNILLDHNLNPKILDFGQAKLCSKEQSIVSMTTARGTIGYIAPEVFSRNFGNVSYKSDIYSFGMLLLEMVGGKKDFDVTVQNTNQLGIQLRDDADAKIAKKLAIVGLWCIQWYPVDRPSMNVVVKMLEGDGDTLIMPANPFSSTNPTATSAVVDVRPVNSELEIIVEFE
ncbi:hypothetical protein ACSBR2_008516 [Camellia fascicularis]